MFYFSFPNWPKRKLAILATLLSLGLGMGCFQNYYRARQAEMEEFQRMVAVGEQEKYFVVHTGGRILHLYDLRLEDMRIKGKYEPLPWNRNRSRGHYGYTEVDEHKRYKRKNKHILQEVHLYLVGDEDYLSLENTTLEAPLSRLQEVYIYEPDKEKTIASHVLLPALGVGAIALLVHTSINSVSGSSCPYIYAYDGQTYSLTGEAFSGAILPSLERHDFMPLPGIKPLNEQYHIRIANELQEREQVNLAYLDVVNHPVDVEVLMSQKGTVHTIRQPQQPIRATTGTRQEVKLELSSADDMYYYFYGSGANRNEVVLEFEKPEGAETAKLILRANATYWASLIFGEYTRQFGTLYDSWINRLQEIPPEQIHNWLSSQAIPLSVYLETKQDWQLVEEVNPIGPLAARDFIVPVNLASHKGKSLKVKLSAGLLFWQLDYAAMDFTADIPVKTVQVLPSFASDSDGNIFTEALAQDDRLYLKLGHTGHQAEISYSVPKKKEGEKQSVFLHSKGYYEPIREYDNYPDVFGLHQFSKPEYLLEFSRERLQWLLEANGFENSPAIEETNIH